MDEHEGILGAHPRETYPWIFKRAEIDDFEKWIENVDDILLRHFTVHFII